MSIYQNPFVSAGKTTFSVGIVGLLAGGKYKTRLPKPILVAIDAGYSDIEFQFAPTDMVQNVSASYAEEASHGRQYPIMQYAGANSQTYSFTALFYAETIGTNIQVYVDALKGAIAYDSALGRPPIWSLVWGDVIADGPLVIESIGDIRYTDIRVADENVSLLDKASNIQHKISDPFSAFGKGSTSSEGGRNLKAVTLNITLKHYEPYTLSIRPPGSPKPNTFYHYVRDGETWEHVAAKHYGDASKGDLLRQQNPDKPILATGDVVLVLKKERFRGLMPTPSSIPLERVTDASRMRADVFATRSARTMPVYGPEAGS